MSDVRLKKALERQAAAIAELNAQGHEVGDPRPVEVPAGFKRPETLAEQVQRLVRSGMSKLASEQGFETFEEAEDFDIGDEPPDPAARYEEWFDPVLGRGITPQEFHDNFEVYKKRHMEAEMRAYREMDLSSALRRLYRKEQREAAEGAASAQSAPGAPAKPSGEKQ